MQPDDIVGRSREAAAVARAVTEGSNLMIEGPVGVGKTRLALGVLHALGRAYHRVDGDGRYTEQKLTGWFDPALVLQRGYDAACFVPGPLVLAMQGGDVLYINELNRMPEGVQNILLPAMDEGRLVVPRLGAVDARPGFVVLATQNPAEFIGTGALGEAILDRFDCVRLDYPGRDEEIAIVRMHVPALDASSAGRIVDLVRATRVDPAFERGASVRAGIHLARWLSGQGPPWNDDSVVDAGLLALRNRVQLDEDQFDLGAWILRQWRPKGRGRGEGHAGNPGRPPAP